MVRPVRMVWERDDRVERLMVGTLEAVRIDYFSEGTKFKIRACYEFFADSFVTTFGGSTLDATEYLLEQNRYYAERTVKRFFEDRLGLVGAVLGEHDRETPFPAIQAEPKEIPAGHRRLLLFEGAGSQPVAETEAAPEMQQGANEESESIFYTLEDERALRMGASELSSLMARQEQAARQRFGPHVRMEWERKPPGAAILRIYRMAEDTSDWGNDSSMGRTS